MYLQSPGVVVVSSGVVVGRENPGCSHKGCQLPYDCYTHTCSGSGTPITYYCVYMYMYISQCICTHTHYHITVHVLVPLCIHYLIKPLLCFGTVLPSYITHMLVWSAGNIESPNLGVCLACELHHPKHWGSAGDSVVWGREY